MRQKERKSMDRPRRLHPVGTTRSPQGGLRHPGGRGPTIEPCSKKKRNALATRSQVGQEGSEKGNHSFLNS
ncbi:hypothetical protein Lalb_Chr08g0236231 [Lupinus albus]|uniref:Uncharacterized protein n=1 Tax=Lupinus albus TaxID=3870 RepID=A0A6A4Q3Q6_LUPAL|nr:hypothetical protein Lalb_Chr08g0236231 [Lupinus albus]